MKPKLNKILVLFFILSTFDAIGQNAKGDYTKANISQFSDLQKDLDDIFNDPNFSNAIWGVVIQSLETGEYLFKRNENKSFIPASNLKVFTTATALALLGPDYKYSTKLITNGNIQNGTLSGDLIIKGSGDPTFPKRNRNDIPTQLFAAWADSLKMMGLKVIQGNVVGDNNCFDKQMLGVGWSWDDETYWYSAQISGLSFNDNCIDISISPGEYAGSFAKINLSPDTKYVKIINEIKTSVTDSTYESDYFFRKPGTNIIKAFGHYPFRGITRMDNISVDNPTLFAATVLKEVLESKGIKVEGEAKDIDDFDISRGTTTIFQTLNTNISVPLSEIIRTINKKSQNLYAEQVLKTIGKEIAGSGTVAKATEIMKKFLSNIGIDPDKFIAVDGSGLSRINLVTPLQMVTLLSYMYRHKYWKDFYNSLPIAGVDGGLQDRMKGTRASGNVHAKTGFVSYVRSLSGYLTTKDGEMLVFTMIVNHYTVPTSLANNIQDLVCVRLSNYSRK